MKIKNNLDSDKKINKKLNKLHSKENNSTKVNIGNVVTTICFLLVIGIFTWCTLLKEDTGFSETENRVLTSEPKFTLEALFDGSFTKEYQAYVRDQFPERNKFVAMRNYVEKCFGKSMINNVLLCKDDYYIEVHNRENYESELANTNLNALRSFTDRYALKLGENNVSAMIVPTAQTVLTNKFYDGMYAYDQIEYLKKISSILPNNVFIDTYSPLKLHDEEYIYYKTDHHWTTFGAYLAYEQWTKDKAIEKIELKDVTINQVANDFYGTINNKLNISMKSDSIYSYLPTNIAFSMEYNMSGEKTFSFFDDKFIDSKDKYGYFFGGNPGLVDITSEVNNNKSLLIIKDSYANCIVPLYAAHFEKTYVVDLRYFNMSIDEFIEEYKVTDILVLYNVDSFATDNYVKRIN